MPPEGYERTKGIERLLCACRYSWRGFSWAVKHEPAFRQEFICFLFAIPLAFWLTPLAIERLILIGVVLFVLIVELLNTALETAINRYSREWHELSGLAKDLGSAAVTLSLFGAAVVWIVVLWERFS